MHISIPANSAVELINLEPIATSPLISKCQIKVCYVSDKPNRNHSVITKEVAMGMAPSLRGSPLVGFYNKEKRDFEEHNREIDISDGKFNIVDTTRPYGFVDLNAKVWFQKFLDDGIEHEYLMTEGYIWSEIYPESKRIIEKGNNQSMELYEKTLQGNWAFDDNGKPTFFIINEAIIQKLCILGEDVEPCFEGAGIAAQFSLDDDFKTKIFSTIKELQLALEGGVTQMDENKITVPEEQESDAEFKKKSEEEETENSSENEDKKDSENTNNSENEKKEDEESEDEKKKKFSLEEIPEYVELQQNYSALEQKYNELVASNESVSNELSALKEEIVPLREFKVSAEKKEKQAMIDSFYMLSDTDKKNVIENIDNYSLKDIEAELSIICVRNKVNFNLDDDKEEKPSNPTVYSLGDSDDGDTAPAWIKAVRNTQNSRSI